MNRILAGCLLGAAIVDGARFKRKQTRTSKDCYSRYDGKALLEVKSCDAKTIEQLQTAIATCITLAEDTPLQVHGECAEESLICALNTTARLSADFAEAVTVVSQDAGAFYRATSGGIEAFTPGVGAMGVQATDEFYSRWRGLDDQMAAVEAAVAGSDGKAKFQVYGQTVEGRQMRAVKITGPGYKAGGPKLLATFNLHAREWVTGMSGVYVVEQIINKAKSGASYLQNAEVVIFPMANPDGFQYSTTDERMWRKNKKLNGGAYYCDGVDLNRNFPVGWGGRYSTSRNECKEVYMGPSSASEPETKAIVKAIDESKLSVLLDVHAYGRYILKPWSYTNNPHPRNAEVDELGNLMYRATVSVRNNRFRYGGNELLGAASGILPDYMNGGLGYTYELSTSFAPSTREILPSGKEVFAGIEAALKWAQ